MMVPKPSLSAAVHSARAARELAPMFDIPIVAPIPAAVRSILAILN